MAERLSRAVIAQNISYAIGTLSLIAATAVVIAAVGYTGAWVDYFFPFVVVAIGQLLYGLLFLLQPWRTGEGGARSRRWAWGRALAVGGILANAALLGLLVYSRVNGLPFGPLAGHALPLSPLCLIVLVVEILLVLALTLFLGRRAASFSASYGSLERIA